MKIRKNFISVYVRKQLVFEVQPQRSPNLISLDFYPWGTLKTPTVSAAVENEDTLRQRIFIPFRPFASAPCVHWTGGGHFEH
jgi:hypothetical protein